jgi:hypothetical protein
MALTLTLMTAPNATLRHVSGRTYVASGTGIVTGIPDTDAVDLQSDFLIFARADFQIVGGAIGQPMMIPLFWAGATADRPKLTGQGTSGLTNPPPRFGMAFNDSTTSSVVYYVGNISSTGWVNGSGAAV